MSILIKFKGNYFLLSKGADSTLLEKTVNKNLPEKFSKDTN